jgi:elongation of very long chain fatty acids protein 6
MTANFSIHAFMYGYYALRAKNIRLPGFVPMTITTAQIVQMVMALVVSSYAWLEQNAGRPCDVDRTTLKISFLFFACYFFLFGVFFFKAYVSGERAKKRKLLVSGKLNADSNGHANGHANGNGHLDRNANKLD